MHLYLHIPFCARRCSYCDFAIAVRREVPSQAYADALQREWQLWFNDPRWAGFSALTTIYLGGGTPSRLDPSVLAGLLGALTADRPLAPGAEVTLEANPEDVTAERARAWRDAGINRVSLGVQSFEPAVLSWMHRTHTADQPAQAVDALRSAGIDRISLDLIYALPPEAPRDWSKDLDRALALAPDHLSLYGLTVEQHTPLSRWVTRKEAHPVTDDRYAEEFLLAHERLTTVGFRHYEVSNYARPGLEAVHNSAYWTRSPYLGLGPSAHSGLGDQRWWNVREYSAWVEAIGQGVSTVAGEETLDAAALTLESLYLGLRTDTGLPAAAVPESVRVGWVRENWATIQSGQLRLTPEGWLRLDALVAQAAG
ncbi:MAG TPA: radical SAM family heme chaperone HemW [Gemmatimonadales bacterium]|nr:radical SAM family heme chaperone HemW [Gemmatimonadales bacterium]